MTGMPSAWGDMIDGGGNMHALSDVDLSAVLKGGRPLGEGGGYAGIGLNEVLGHGG